jgi:hypothetical protein
MYLHYLASFGYGTGAGFFRGDVDIIDKAFNFTKACIQNDWVASYGDIVDPKMTLVNPTKAYDYFNSTFSEKEKFLLEYEIESKKKAHDAVRERLLTDAGYLAGQEMRFTGKGFAP